MRSAAAMPQSACIPTVLFTVSGSYRVSTLIVHEDCENRPMIEIREEPSDGAAGKDLLSQFIGRLVELYGDYDPTRTPSATPEEMAPPTGAFLVIYDGGDPIACGGVKQLA